MQGRAGEGLRRHNLAALLRHVHLQGPTSRAELTAALGLNRSTVGDLAGQLVQVGLVTQEPPPASLGVGRPSLLVRPRPAGAQVLALHLDVHHLAVAVVGVGGEVLARGEQPVARGTSPRVVVEAAADLAGGLWGDRLCHVVGVGVAVPGTVDLAQGRVGDAPHLGWSDVPLGAVVTAVMDERLSWSPPRVSVANDADLGMVAEVRRGTALGCTDALYLCGTWGMGGGIITGGHPLTGARGHGGEIGHVGVNPEGRACHCGSRGCWEAESMVDAWAAPLELDAAARDVSAAVLERLAQGGVAARRSRDRLSRSFARGLASMVNLLDPEVVVLGAGLWRDLWPELHEEVGRWLDRTVLPAMRGRVDVRLSALGADSSLLGAAETAFEPLMADPVAVADHQEAG